jgi:tetratricopeptide (TPR) repeat protein
MKILKNKKLIVSFSAIGAVLLAIIVWSLTKPDSTTNTGADVQSGHVADGDNVYVNTKPEVKYVGSEACRSCHLEIYETYLDSEMGRSMTKLGADDIIESFPQKKAVYDSSKNFYYEMIRKGDDFYQREYRLDDKGKVVHERTMKADYVIGSGNNLRMYFNNENGMFYELPLTWYSHKKQWDFSPGYRDFANLRFSRFVTRKCLSCHNAYLEPSAAVNDHYIKPYPLGISCERCHGPGELHVAEKRGEKLADLPENARTIVNPAKLSPQRQLDVCRQCHLQGKGWALRDGSDWFDFRPGMLLESHRSVYFPEKTKKEVFEVADSAKRLALSRCFTESESRMTCLSCHNPHLSIKTFSKAHYNSACQVCHTPDILPVTNSSHVHSAADDCISCHMNRTGTDNTLHGVTNTDHWIRVDASQTAIDWSIVKQSPSDQPQIRLTPEVDAEDDASDIRLGIAYFDYYNEQDHRPAYLDSAALYLSAGLLRDADNAAGHFHLGQVRFEQGQLKEAIQSFSQAISLQPQFPEAYYRLGKTYSALRNHELAIQNYRQAIQLKREEPTYLESLGMKLAEAGDAQSALIALESALSVDQQNPLTYYTVGNLYLVKLQQPEKAIPYYEEMMKLDPDLPNGYLNMGNAHTLLGNHDAALAAYRKESEVQPNSPSPFINMARVYALMGRKGDARSALEKALKIDPNQPLIKQLITELDK